MLAFNLPFPVGLAFVTLSSFLALLLYFSPVDYRWNWIKKKWHLPPGPGGQAIVGNLLQMFEARDAGKFSHYVSLIIPTLRALLSNSFRL